MGADEDYSEKSVVAVKGIHTSKRLLRRNAQIRRCQVTSKSWDYLVQGVGKKADHLVPVWVCLGLETLIFSDHIYPQCLEFLLRLSGPRRPRGIDSGDTTWQMGKRVEGANQRSLKDVGEQGKQTNPAELCYSEGKVKQDIKELEVFPNSRTEGMGQLKGQKAGGSKQTSSWW